MNEVTLTQKQLISISSNNIFKIRKCWNCKKSTCDKLSTCSNCSTAYYCNRECQKADWSKHSPICKEYVGNNKLTHELDSYTQKLTIKDIPAGTMFGYIVQIKDTRTYFKCVNQGLTLSSIPKIDTSDKMICYTNNTEIFVSFCHKTLESFMTNYEFIEYLMDLNHDTGLMSTLFKEGREKGEIPVIVYSHDLKHYCLWNIHV